MACPAAKKAPRNIITIINTRRQALCFDIIFNLSIHFRRSGNAVLARATYFAYMDVGKEREQERKLLVPDISKPSAVYVEPKVGGSS
jgi:hypothetical protein